MILIIHGVMETGEMNFDREIFYPARDPTCVPYNVTLH